MSIESSTTCAVQGAAIALMIREVNKARREYQGMPAILLDPNLVTVGRGIPEPTHVLGLPGNTGSSSPAGPSQRLLAKTNSDFLAGGKQAPPAAQSLMQVRNV